MGIGVLGMVNVQHTVGNLGSNGAEFFKILFFYCVVQPMFLVLPSSNLGSSATPATASAWRFPPSGTPARRRNFPEPC